MKKIASGDVPQEPVALAGSTGTFIQWLIRKDAAPHFMMRKFEVKPGGQIGLHEHPEEHEIYVLAGRGRVFNDQGDEVEAGPGDFLFVPSGEPHGYETLGAESLVFLCVIPKIE